jgi:hypothetical protein
MAPRALLIIVGGSFLLLGGFVGWLLGHAIGFTEGVEREKVRQLERAKEKDA